LQQRMQMETHWEHNTWEFFQHCLENYISPNVAFVEANTTVVFSW